MLEAGGSLSWAGASELHLCRPTLLPAPFLLQTFIEDQNAFISGVLFMAVFLLRLLGLLPQQPALGCPLHMEGGVKETGQTLLPAHPLGSRT